MFGLLIALVLLAPAVCAVVPLSPLAAVAAAGAVIAVTPSPFVRAGCTVAARFAVGTARSGQIEDEGCAGGGCVTMARMVSSFPDVLALSVVPDAPPGP